MKVNSSIFILLLAIALCSLPNTNLFAGGVTVQETDTADFQLVGFFDLRDRESFIQITNTGSSAQTIHIQLFDAANLCNENNFFDAYTPNDTHIYNIRDIQTNDGNPSGVVLPDEAYGIIVVTYLDDQSPTMLGNLRIEDNSGYEYRTNLNGIGVGQVSQDFVADNTQHFNFNSEGGVVFSDIIGFDLDNAGNTDPPAEVLLSDILNQWISLDIDIYDNNEVPFSCRNVIFACTNKDNPLNDELLAESGDASVASLEYGINDAIPHSRSGELLCPNNIISEGIVRMQIINFGITDGAFTVFVGLNNGNGRGTMDALWYNSSFFRN